MSRPAWLILMIALVASPTLVAGEGKIRKFKRVVPGEYVVAFPAEISEPEQAATELARKYKGTLLHIFVQAPTGFAIQMSEANALKLSADPLVSFVEENAAGEASALQEVGVSGPDGEIWHLDRVNQREATLDGTYTYCSKGYGTIAYVIDTGIQANHPEFRRQPTDLDQSARVLGGVDLWSKTSSNYAATHPQEACKDTTIADFPFAPDGSISHGTAVASVLGGYKFGVAKSVKFVPVRAMACSGRVSAAKVIAALDWIVNPCPAPPQVCNPQVSNANANDRPAVINFSGFVDTADSNELGQVPLVETKFDSMITRGITVVTSANNFSTSACYDWLGGQYYNPQGYSPARMGRGGWGVKSSTSNPVYTDPPAPRMITVGASARTTTSQGVPADTRWTMSNFGPCVSIFAPGSGIRIAYAVMCSTGCDTCDPGTGNCVYNTETQGSGTSLSAPMIAGAIARFLQSPELKWGDPMPSNYDASMPNAAWDWLLRNATGVALGTSAPLVDTGSSDTQNRLLWMSGSPWCRAHPADR